MRQHSLQGLNTNMPVEGSHHVHHCWSGVNVSIVHVAEAVCVYHASCFTGAVHRIKPCSTCGARSSGPLELGDVFVEGPAHVVEV